MGTSVDDEASTNSHAFGSRVLVVNGINFLCAGRGAEDISGNRWRGMEVAEVEKENHR